MITRVFGAVAGPGVQVREIQPGRPILDGPLGSTVLVGMFRSGPVDEVVECEGFDHYRRVFGGISQSSEAPLAAEDFFGAARGAGTLYVVRVSDDDEVQAQVKLFTRNASKSIQEITPATLAELAYTVKAKNGGRWGGRRERKSGDVGTVSGAITGTGTIDLGLTAIKDEWVGATLKFPSDSASASYTVVGNTAAGVFTISGDFDAATKAGTDGRWVLELDNVHELTGDREALALVVKDGGSDAKLFNVEAYRDGSAVKAWDDIGLDSAGDAYWINAINDDDRQWELTVSQSLTGDVNAHLNRPANFAEIPAPSGVSSDGNTITFQTVRWTRTSAGAGNPYVDTVNDFSAPSSPIPLKITLTWTSGTTATVAAENLHTGEAHLNLPSLTLGTAYASQNQWLPGLTVSDGGSAPTAGDTLVLYYRPLPANLERKGGLFYPAAAPSEGDVRSSYAIRSNTSSRITLSVGVDVSSECTAPGAPTQTGSIAGTYDLSTGTNTFKYQVEGRTEVTLTSTLSGAAETTTALAADLNAQELARVSAVAANKVVEFTVSTDDKLVVTCLQDFGDVDFTVTDGGLNARLGFTDDTIVQGATPTIGRIEWSQELEGGVDGFASIADADYVQAFGLATSDPLAELDELNTGLIKAAIPGVTSATVQAAAMLWAYTKNALFYSEIPSGKITASDAIAWHASNLAVGRDAGQDYHRALWPTYGKRSNPYGRGLYTGPITGFVLGMEARKASEAKGHHLAPAGVDYRIDSVFSDLTTGRRKLDGEAITKYGLCEVRRRHDRRGNRIFVFGDRIPGDGRRPFFHVRATIQHVGRILLTNTEHLVFQPLRGETFFRARKDLRNLFTPWFLAGWFDDSDGAAFEDQVEIKVDETNNPPAERALGNLNVGLAFLPVGTSERVVYSLGSKGLSESA